MNAMLSLKVKEEENYNKSRFQSKEIHMNFRTHLTLTGLEA